MSIISEEERWRKRKQKEAAFIKITDNTISKPSLDINDVWTPILMSDRRRSYMAQSDIDRISNPVT